MPVVALRTLALALLWVGGLASEAQAANLFEDFQPAGYVHTDFAFGVLPAGSTPEALLGTHWTLDSHEARSLGRRGNSWRHKRTDEWRSNVSVDVDGDGEVARDETSSVYD